LVDEPTLSELEGFRLTPIGFEGVNLTLSTKRVRFEGVDEESQGFVTQCHFLPSRLPQSNQREPGVSVGSKEVQLVDELGMTGVVQCGGVVNLFSSVTATSPSLPVQAMPVGNSTHDSYRHLILVCPAPLSSSQPVCNWANMRSRYVAALCRCFFRDSFCSRCVQVQG